MPIFLKGVDIIKKYTTEKKQQIINELINTESRNMPTYRKQVLFLVIGILSLFVAFYLDYAYEYAFFIPNVLLSLTFIVTSVTNIIYILFERKTIEFINELKTYTDFISKEDYEYKKRYYNYRKKINISTVFALISLYICYSYESYLGFFIFIIILLSLINKYIFFSKFKKTKGVYIMYVN